MPSSTNSLVQEYFSLLSELGKATLNSLYPNDFEYYLMSLELVNSDGKTVDFLVFPVNPDSFMEDNNNIISIQKTAGGIMVQNTSTFQPVNIQMSGTFGRRFKFLIGRDSIDATAIQFGNEGKNDSVFSNQVKTGYGVTKVLENILNMSRKVDSKGNPFKLYFYNQALGNSYLVKANNWKFSQNVGNSNQMWEYQLSMTGIAPVNTSTKSKNSMTLTDLCSKKIIQKGIDIAYTQINRELTTYNRNQSIVKTT